MIEGASETEPVGTGWAPGALWALCSQKSGVASGKAQESNVSDCGVDEKVKQLNAK